MNLRYKATTSEIANPRQCGNAKLLAKNIMARIFIFNQQLGSEYKDRFEPVVELLRKKSTNKKQLAFNVYQASQMFIEIAGKVSAEISSKLTMHNYEFNTLINKHAIEHGKPNKDTLTHSTTGSLCTYYTEGQWVQHNILGAGTIAEYIIFDSSDINAKIKVEFNNSILSAIVEVPAGTIRPYIMPVPEFWERWKTAYNLEE